jgi:hypothetical protein
VGAKEVAADISFALGSGQIMCSLQNLTLLLTPPLRSDRIARATRLFPIAGTTGQTSELTITAWETPEFTEVKMDAEINSYQDDFEREEDDRF